MSFISSICFTLLYFDILYGCATCFYFTLLYSTLRYFNSPNRFICRGSYGVVSKGPCFLSRSVRACGDSFLCAGCGNGEGHVAPVYAKWSPALVFAVKLNGFSRFSLKIASGALGAFGCPLGLSWVSPGCVLGVSWVPLVAPGYLLDGPEWSWVLLNASWVTHGCLL